MDDKVTKIPKNTRDPNFSSDAKNYYSLQNGVALKMLKKSGITVINKDNFLMSARVCGEDYIEKIPSTSTKYEIREKRNAKSQTNYRESEAQTDYWKPEVKISHNVNRWPEVLFAEGVNDVPGEKEIQKIERDRIRRQWEKDVQIFGMSYEQRIEQLKAFELEKLLTREKTFNKSQDDRIQYVIDVMKNRDENNTKRTEKLIQNAIRTNEAMKYHVIEKLHAVHQRKLRKLLKLHEHEVKSATKKVSKSVLNDQLIKDDFEINTKIDWKKRKSLWIPKNYSKPTITDLNSEKKLKHINEVLHKFNQSEKTQPVIKCQKREDSINDNTHNYKIDESIERAYQNKILLSKTIKGATTREMLMNEMTSHIKLIKKNKKDFQLQCLQNISPQVAGENEDSDDNDDNSDILASVIENVHKNSSTDDENNLYDLFEVQNMVTNVLQDAVVIAQDELNKRALKEANDERLKRRKLEEIDNIKQKIRDLREEKLTKRNDDLHKDLVSEIMNQIIPVLIEMISEKEAIEFIQKKAEEISINAFKGNLNEKEEIEKFLNDVILPIINTKLCMADEHEYFLLACHDAFEFFLKQMQQ